MFKNSLTATLFVIVLFLLTSCNDSGINTQIPEEDENPTRSLVIEEIQIPNFIFQGDTIDIKFFYTKLFNTPNDFEIPAYQNHHGHTFPVHEGTENEAVGERTLNLTLILADDALEQNNEYRIVFTDLYGNTEEKSFDIKVLKVPPAIYMDSDGLEVLENEDHSIIQEPVSTLMWEDRFNYSLFTYSEANTSATDSSLGGYSDWRLPSRAEIIRMWRLGYFDRIFQTDYVGENKLLVWTTDYYTGDTPDHRYVLNMKTGDVTHHIHESEKAVLIMVRD